jgi:AraC-like DNA-binding protein
MLATRPGRFLVIIDLPPPPFSPWLRLAHQVAWTRSPGTGLGTRRQLRDWQFLLQLSGESWLWYEQAGGSWPLQPGDLALVPPATTYAWGVPLGSHLAVHFDLHAQPALASPDMVVITGGAQAAQPLAACPLLELRLGGEVRRCRAVVRVPSPRRWQERFAPLLRQHARGEQARPGARLAAAGILAAALADWLDLAAADPAGNPADLAVGALVDALATEVPARDLDIPALAHRCGLGETAFRAAFLRCTGATPRAWLERRRIAHAATLLRDAGLPVAAAAAEVGYDDPFHFTRVFRRVMGRSPRAWRSGGG